MLGVGDNIMRSVIAVVAATVFAFASPAFAQGVASPNPTLASSAAPKTTPPLLLEGQDAMAQEGTNPNPYLVGGLVIVGGVIVGVIIANANRSHSP